MVPADCFSGSGHAHELGDRCRNEQRVRVQIDEAVVAIERAHHDAPGGAAHAGLLCCGEDLGTKPDEWVGARTWTPRRTTQQSKVENAKCKESRGCATSRRVHYFTASIAFITSSSPMPSTFAVPGSSERLAKTSVPIRPKVTVSCLFSAKVTVTTSAGDLSDALA